jgi:hypothetical protein
VYVNQPTGPSGVERGAADGRGMAVGVGAGMLQVITTSIRTPPIKAKKIVFIRITFVSDSGF